MISPVAACDSVTSAAAERPVVVVVQSGAASAAAVGRPALNANAGIRFTLITGLIPAYSSSALIPQFRNVNQSAAVNIQKVGNPERQ